MTSTTTRTPAHPLTADQRRERRVLTALLLLIGLSVFDLDATASAMLTWGMFEANPIARWLVEVSNSVAPLALLKALSVGTCVALLYWLRASRSAEMAAWALTVVMTVVAIQWGHYNATMADVDPTEFAASAASDATWVRVSSASGGDASRRASTSRSTPTPRSKTVVVMQASMAW